MEELPPLTLKQGVKLIITSALRRNPTRTAAAKELAISRKCLYQKIRLYGLSQRWTDGNPNKD
jgi:transcriptional regulator with PAS, ATPase and Fis domain